jgi:hypothetical protein
MTFRRKFFEDFNENVDGVIAQTICWENLDPIHWMTITITVGELIVTSNKPSLASMKEESNPRGSLG